MTYARPDRPMLHDLVAVGSAERADRTLPVIRAPTVQGSAREVAAFAGTLRPDSLRASFLSALNKLQPVRIDFDLEQPLIRLNFGHNDDLNVPLVRELMTVDSLEPGWQYTPDEAAVIAGTVAESLELLRAAEPELHATLHLLVGSLVFARREHFGGGSVSTVIGAIWLAPQLAMTPTEYADYILHEFVHQCLFLDDMVNTIFAHPLWDMERDDGLVTSAILKRRRSFDKAFHSAYVALALMQFYERLQRPEQARTFLDSLRTTADELHDRLQFLTDHGRRRLSELLERIP